MIEQTMRSQLSVIDADFAESPKSLRRPAKSPSRLKANVETQMAECDRKPIAFKYQSRDADATG
jgi:hypothetical protein